MKIVILGAGRRGFRLAKHLIDEQRDVVIIDSDLERTNAAAARLDCMAVTGSGTDLEVLREAGCESADAFVAVTDSDEINLVSCGLVSSEFHVENTVAAIRNLSYTGTKGLSGSLLGINYIVNPEAEAAQSIYNIVERGIYSDVITFQNTDLILYNIFVTENSKFANRNVMSLRNAMKADFVIAAINRADGAIVPSGHTMIHPGDTLSLVADDSDVAKIFQNIGQRRKKPKKIVLVGGSKIAHFLLGFFSSGAREDIVLVDQKPDVCTQFATMYPELLVIKADITDESILEEEHLLNYDLLISLTDNDELNIITASYAKRAGIARSMALVKHNNNYIRLASFLDIDSVISTTEATVDSLLRYLRGKNVSSIHSLFNGRLEVYEFKIMETSKVCGKKLSEIDMRNRAIIAGITDTDGKNLIPSGSYKLAAGDIVLVTVNRESVDFVQKMFNEGGAA
ncbi:MAG: Trk system potassium transporter TrkA [Sphaerochaetaceae bacterium]|jgi:trk system potassium uptake protein TrkA